MHCEGHQECVDPVVLMCLYMPFSKRFSSHLAEVCLCVCFQFSFSVTRLELKEKTTAEMVDVKQTRRRRIKRLNYSLVVFKRLFHELPPSAILVLFCLFFKDIFLNTLFFIQQNVPQTEEQNSFSLTVILLHLK